MSRLTFSDHVYSRLTRFASLGLSGGSTSIRLESLSRDEGRDVDRDEDEEDELLRL